METKTLFSEIYNRFLEMITDDMYIELTPEDTLRDLQSLLINAIPGFEYPRVCLDDNYEIKIDVIEEKDLKPGQFTLSVLWGNLTEDGESCAKIEIDSSYFKVKLSSEEKHILALLMKQGWVQRQVTSIENTRMKYSGSDFKMTSQANHLAKLLSLLEESQRESFHMQRLYKRREKNDSNVYRSTWYKFGPNAQ